MLGGGSYPPMLSDSHGAKASCSSHQPTVTVAADGVHRKGHRRDTESTTTFAAEEMALGELQIVGSCWSSKGK